MYEYLLLLFLVMITLHSIVFQIIVTVIHQSSLVLIVVPQNNTEICWDFQNHHLDILYRH